MRDTPLVDSFEDCRSLPLNCKLEQSSRANVDIRIRCREDEQQNTAVDEGGQELDTGESDGDYEGTGSCVGGTE